MSKQADLIKEIIPYLDENFITFPLWEEGDYTPKVNLWRYFETFNNLENFLNLKFQTEDISVHYEVEEVPVVRTALVEVDNELQLEQEPTGELTYMVSIGITYMEKLTDTLELDPLIEVAANIARYKSAKD